MRISDWSSDVCSSDLNQASVDEDFLPEGTDFVARRRRDVLHQRHVGGDIMTPRRQHPPWIRHASDDHVAGSNRRTGGYRAKADRGAGAGVPDEEIGRASGRERGCQYVLLSVGAGPLKKKTKQHT